MVQLESEVPVVAAREERNAERPQPSDLSVALLVVAWRKKLMVRLFLLFRVVSFTV